MDDEPATRRPAVARCGQEAVDLSNDSLKRSPRARGKDMPKKPMTEDAEQSLRFIKSAREIAPDDAEIMFESAMKAIASTSGTTKGSSKNRGKKIR